jgi:2-oxo-4-hydroxy-4-carboxy-5-ureidoimidazoline decarboxylase
MTIVEISAMPLAEFVAAVGWVFEASPWVAERSWASRPFADKGSLCRAMVKAVESASREEQLALLCAHPDLGARARMSPASVSEQSGAGLDHLTGDEYERLQTLNAQYRDRFGFPFLLAVKGSTKFDILNSLERRTASTPEDEFREALKQVYRIACFRLSDVVTSM